MYLHVLKVQYYVPVLQKPEMKKPISKKDMTKEEIKKIHVNDFFFLSEYTLKGKLNLFHFLAWSFVQMLFVFCFIHILQFTVTFLKLHTYMHVHENSVHWIETLLKKNILLKFLSDFILTRLYNFDMLCVRYIIKISLKHANLFNFAETASFGPTTSGVVLQWNSVCQLWWRKTGPSSK